MMNDADFHISDNQFKTIIALSLPESWDAFTEPYIGRRIGVIETDPKKQTSSQEFIGILKEEYIKRKNRNGTSTTHTLFANTNRAKPSLKSHFRSPDKPKQQKTTGKYCQNCKQATHDTPDCKWLGQPKCT